MPVPNTSATDCSSIPEAINWQTHLTDTQPQVKQWLLSTELLTQQLRDLSNNQFAVQTLREDVLRTDECLALGLATGSLGWIREVILLGNNQPWVYARSVAPLQHMQHSTFDLTQIGNRSLGEALFKQNDFQRHPIEVTQFPCTWLPKSLQLTDNCATIWARRSRFAHPALSVLVAEAFLPAFWQAAGQP